MTVQTDRPEEVAAPRLPTLTLVQAATAPWRARAVALRHQIYDDRAGLYSDAWSDALERDTEAYIFALVAEDTMVATGRVLPVTSPACELKQLVTCLPDDL